MKMIPCYCNKEVEFDFPEELDLSAHPEVIDTIMDGTFMSVRCPYCGKLLKPEEPIRVYDSGGTLDLELVPELQRNAFLSGRYKVKAPRAAVGFPELAEKIAIYLAGLDERAVEVLKLPGMNRESDRDISIYFSALEGDSLVFHIHGLDPDRIGVTKISRELYTRTMDTIEGKKPDPVYRDIITPPYISVKKIYREDAE